MGARRMSRTMEEATNLLADLRGAFRMYYRCRIFRVGLGWRMNAVILSAALIGDHVHRQDSD